MPTKPALSPTADPARAVFDSPVVAIGAMVCLFAIGLAFGSDHFLAHRLPTAAFGDSPRDWLIGHWHVDVLGSAVSDAIVHRGSLVLFLLDCIVVIAICRRWPSIRDLATVIGGACWVLASAGWQFALCTLAISAIIHYGFRRVNSHIAMILTLLMLLLCFVYAIPIQPSSQGMLANAAFEATYASMALGSLRLIMYSFEASSVPPKTRSYLTVLAYSPLGLFLWPADPPMTSYLMYATKLPRAKLDRQGSRQLYRSGLKYVLMVLMLRMLRLILPPGSSFDDASPAVWVLWSLIAPTMLYLRISLVADFAYGLSSFAGFHVADAFDAPVFADNPVTFWQTWNIPVLSFLRRAFIFPLAKWRRSIAITIIAGTVGSALVHSCMAWLRMGPGISTRLIGANFHQNLVFFTANAIVLTLGIPLYVTRTTRTRRARIVLVIGTQLVMGFLMFGMLSENVTGVAHIPSPLFEFADALQKALPGR